ncbi:hypothetical protein OC835_001142 [Tilletia horrida]|uniref:Ketoreductase domain-containing protein n=1 Tax=Tilletia horrida TaxID=155126 RepID=A0AAN6GAS2_9BASI|nr:hypothetical protein OC842_003981 [Tilletia horrida]KAK0539393.1 hypothetical protein OC835_001142 [Tilletia horrida]
MSSAAPCILLTGASRGIGLAALQLLLELPASLRYAPSSPPPSIIAVSRSLTPELQTLASKHAERVEIVQGDVTAAETNERIVRRAQERFGRLDALILNAGVLGMGKLGDVSNDTFSEVINVNLVSLYSTINATLPLLRKSPQGLGRVVLVSSGAAVSAVAGWGAYCVSKAGAIALGRVLAVEEKDLAVWSIRPGVVDTEMQGQIRTEGGTHMDASTRERFLVSHTEGKLLPAHKPAHVLCTLALRGTRQDPRLPGEEGKGAGAEGAFVSWDSPELKEWRAEE